MKYVLFEDDEYQICYKRNQETDKQIVDKLIELFKQNHCSCPESVADNQNLQCEGASVLSEFAEILKLGE